MSGIAPLGGGFIPPSDLNQYRSNGSVDAPRRLDSPADRDEDTIELSPTARRLALLDRVMHDLPVREDLISRVRAEIASGRYESSEKIDRVIDEVWEDLQGE